MRSFLVVAALALPIPAAVAGCGGGGGSGDNGKDPQEVIDSTFNNDKTASSGVVDISIKGSAEGDSGGSFEADLSGPFQGDPSKPNELPQLDWTGSIKADGAGQSIDKSAEITVTDDDAFITYNDQAYDVGKDTFSQFTDQIAKQTPDTSSGTGNFSEKFKQGCEDALKQQGGTDTSACDIDLSSWFTDLSNDGSDDVEGTDTTHISGGIDVEKMLGDLVKLGTAVPSASASGLSPDVIQSQVGTISDAVDDAKFDIYSGNDDNILRKLDFTLGIDPSSIPGASSSGVGKVSVEFAVTLSDVNQDQTITAPTNTKPLSDLTGQLGSIPGLGSSIPGLGGSSGSSSGSSSSGSSAGDSAAAQKYLDCISKATTPAEINACPAP